jgi:RNA polymerase sigma-70 factor (ECF subfamily)
LDTTPSFDEVLRLHGAMIARIAASHEADPGLAEDLVQDILLALWRALPSFRGEGPLRAYVARLAANRALAHVKRAMARPRPAPLAPDLPAPDPGAEAGLIAGEGRERLLAAVRALPLGLKEPAVLALEGLPAAEIAAVLGVTPNAAAIRLTRARAALRTLMGDRP